jgi:hypothetical protein
MLWSSVPFAAELGVALKIKDTAGKQVGLYRGSYALLVGASEYRAGWPKLPGVVSDITLVRNVFGAAWFPSQGG